MDGLFQTRSQGRKSDVSRQVAEPKILKALNFWEFPVTQILKCADYGPVSGKHDLLFAKNKSNASDQKQMRWLF